MGVCDQHAPYAAARQKLAHDIGSQAPTVSRAGSISISHETRAAVLCLCLLRVLVAVTTEACATPWDKLLGPSVFSVGGRGPPVKTTHAVADTPLLLLLFTDRDDKASGTLRQLVHTLSKEVLYPMNLKIVEVIRAPVFTPAMGVSCSTDKIHPTWPTVTEPTVASRLFKQFDIISNPHLVLLSSLSHVLYSSAAAEMCTPEIPGNTPSSSTQQEHVPLKSLDNEWDRMWETETAPSDKNRLQDDFVTGTPVGSAIYSAGHPHSLPTREPESSPSSPGKLEEEIIHLQVSEPSDANSFWEKLVTKSDQTDLGPGRAGRKKAVSPPSTPTQPKRTPVGDLSPGTLEALHAAQDRYITSIELEAKQYRVWINFIAPCSDGNAAHWDAYAQFHGVESTNTEDETSIDCPPGRKQLSIPSLNWIVNFPTGALGPESKSENRMEQSMLAACPAIACAINFSEVDDLQQQEACDQHMRPIPEQAFARLKALENVPSDHPLAQIFSCTPNTNDVAETDHLADQSPTFMCDICAAYPIVKIRYHSTNIPTRDICAGCFRRSGGNTNGCIPSGEQFTREDVPGCTDNVCTSCGTYFPDKSSLSFDGICNKGCKEHVVQLQTADSNHLTLAAETALRQYVSIFETKGAHTLALQHIALTDQITVPDLCVQLIGHFTRLVQEPDATTLSSNDIISLSHFVSV